MAGNIDFEKIVSSLFDMIAVLVEGADRFEWVSERWTKVLGWTPEEMTSRPFLDFVHPDDQARTEETARTGHDVELSNFTNRYRHRDGGYRWLEWHSSPLDDGRTYGVARDVTELRLLRVRELAQSYQSLLEHVGNIGFWRRDFESGEFFWSPQARLILGMDEASAPYRALSIDRVHPEDRDRVYEEWRRALAAQSGFSFELRVSVDGKAKVLRMAGEPESSPAPALIGIVQDITEHKLVEGRLRESEKLAAIGTMAAGIAHEINNPLSYIYSNAQILREELEELLGPTPPKRQLELLEMIRDIEDGSQRIAAIVRGLKSFSRSQEDLPRRLEVGELLQTAMRLTTNEVKQHARLELDVRSGLPPILGDEPQMVQVLVNLLINACHAVADGEDRHIRVRALPSGGGVRVEVEDDGCGMSDSVCARAFEPFFTTKPHGIGTGLGLSISHGIVKRFGGHISIRSTPGQGTCVAIHLPAAPPGEDPEPAPSPPPSIDPIEPARVLIIEEDESVGRSTSRLLAHHSVLVVDDARAALERLRTEDFDVILCDVTMLGAVELERALGDARLGLLDRFIWVSGGVFSSEARELIERSSQPLLEKPIDAPAARAAVARILAEAE